MLVRYASDDRLYLYDMANVKIYLSIESEYFNYMFVLFYLPQVSVSISLLQIQVHNQLILL